MFSDPQSITVNAIAISLPKTSTDVNTGVYTSADGNTSLLISHQYGNRTQRRAKFTQRKVAEDPYSAGVSKDVDQSVTVLVNVPKQGFTVTETKQLADAVMAYFTASSGAKLTQLLGGEN